MREWAWNVGSYDCFVNQQWLLHDYDVWLLNPHYQGTGQPHPEDEVVCSECNVLLEEHGKHCDLVLVNESKLTVSYFVPSISEEIPF